MKRRRLLVDLPIHRIGVAFSEWHRNIASYEAEHA